MTAISSLEPSDGEALIGELYSRFNDRDTDRLTQLLHPDATWINASKNLRLHGVAEILSHWRDYWRVVAIELTPVSIRPVSSGFSVHVRERIVSRSGEQVFDGPVGHVFTVQDGLVTCCLILDIEDASREAAETDH